MQTYRVIGMMSGTSMDGIDLAYCELKEKENGKWEYEIKQTQTIAYSEVWRLRLTKLRNQNALIFYKTNRYKANETSEFQGSYHYAGLSRDRNEPIKSAFSADKQTGITLGINHKN